MRPRWFHVALLAFSLLAIAGFIAARLFLLPRRFFDPDEFEHAHAAWLMSKGMVPYRDFFEHHTPWYYYVLRPFFNWFHVEASFDSARRFLYAGRGLSVVLTALSAALVYRIGRLWRDPLTGVVGALLFVAQPVVLQKSIEIRPDMLALPFFLAGLLLLLRGLERTRTDVARGGRSAPQWFFAAGLAVGAAVMSTQKVLFVLPGMLAGLGIWTLAADPATKIPVRARVGLVALFLAGVAVPGLLTWAVFAAQHAGREFIDKNFLLNARWKHFETRVWEERVDLTSRRVLVAALGGAALCLARMLPLGWTRVLPLGWKFEAEDRARVDRSGTLVLLATAVGLFVGLWVVPVAHRQYYLLPFPIVGLFAAEVVLWLAARLPILLRPVAVGLAMLGLLWKPVNGVQDEWQRGDPVQLVKLRTVFERTAPTDVVMDGWEGLGVFRPHALYHYFLHEEIRAMVPQATLDGYIADLESGRVRPKLIVMDDSLRALGPRFDAFVESHYERRPYEIPAAATPRLKALLEARRGHADDDLYFARAGSD